MLGSLVLSALFVNGVHAYLLWSQRSERQWSISAHSARDKQTYLLYIAGHVLGGLFFLLFAYEFFTKTYDASWLFVLSCIGVVFEYAQAASPAKGSTDFAHTITAYCMFLTYALVTILSEITLPLSTLTRVLAAPFLLAIVVLGIYSRFNRQKTYLLQMIAIGSFCASMIIMALGALG